MVAYGVILLTEHKPHYEHGNAIVLIFSRTETRMFFDYIWNCADAVLFLKGRLTFYHASGQQGNNVAGAASVLIAYGKDNADVLASCSIPGKFIALK